MVTNERNEANGGVSLDEILKRFMVVGKSEVTKGSSMIFHRSFVDYFLALKDQDSNSRSAVYVLSVTKEQYAGAKVGEFVMQRLYSANGGMDWYLDERSARAFHQK